MYHIKPMTYLELHCRGTHVPHKANDISGVTLQRDTCTTVIPENSIQTVVADLVKNFKL